MRQQFGHARRSLWPLGRHVTLFRWEVFTRDQFRVKGEASQKQFLGSGKAPVGYQSAAGKWSAAQRNPRLEAELSGVFWLRAAQRYL